MAEADWSFMTDGASAGTVIRGVSSGFTVPNGGGSFIFGFHSLASAGGTVGLYTDLTNFAPLSSGASIRGTMQRATGSGTTAFAPMFFIGVQSNPPSINDSGYLLGLSDNSPSEIVLRKGAPSGGLDPTGADILATSSTTFAAGTWVHLRLDVINNPNGDVVINIFESDLTSNPVTAPVWTAVPGISVVIDDALQVLTGNAPLLGGFVGYAFESSALNRRGLFDHVAVLRQV